MLELLSLAHFKTNVIIVIEAVQVPADKFEY